MKLNLSSSSDFLDLAANATAQGYKPKNLPAAQIQMESGGKQLDKDGKPLLGRYRDGTAPKKEEQAFGVSQIQIRTARETAKKHGIPWDEKKMLNDKDYNLRLGDLHKGDLLKYYKGDKALAIAAYHSGTGNVDKALSKHGRANFTEGLGPEGRNYVKKLAGEGSGGSSRGGIPMTVEVDKGQYSGAKPTVGPKTGPESGGGKADAFSLEGEARFDAARVSASANTLDTVFKEVSQGIQSVQEDKRQLLEAKVATNEVLLADQAAETQARMDALRPIFARREAIAARKVEVADMGFLERTFAGLFNRNYDPEYLDNLDGALQGQIAESTLEWETMSRNREQLGNILNERYTDEASIVELSEKVMLQDLGLAQTGHGIASTKLAATLTGIDTDIQILRAQSGLRDEATSQLIDTGTINTLIAQARANPDGKVIVNGVPFSEADLIARGKAVESQDAQYKLLQLSIANGEQGLIDRQMESYIMAMTPTERAAAAANGGVDPKTGQQLNPKILVEAIGTDQQLATGVANSFGEQAAAAKVYEQVQGYGRALQVTIQRSAQVFGRGDSPLTQVSNAQTDQMTQLLTQLKGMPEGPAKTKIEAQVQSMLGVMAQQQDKAVDTMVKGYTKDSYGQALIGAYVRGQEVTPELATKGFIGLTKGGASFPKLDPRSPVAPVVAAMQRAVNAEIERAGGKEAVVTLQSLTTPAGKASAAELELKLMAAVKKAATGAWLNGTMNDFIDATPEWAKADGHPAGNIRSQDLKIARTKGDQVGFQRYASSVQGMTPQEVDSIVGPKGRGTQAPAAVNRKLSEQQVQQMRSNLRITQTNAMIELLDSSESAKPGFRPSLALAEFMQGNSFQGRANAVSSNTSRMGLAEATVVGIAGGPTLGATSQSFAREFANAAFANDSVVKERLIENAAQYRTDPMRRTRAVVASLDGFDPASEKVLITALEQAGLFKVPAGTQVSEMGPGRSGIERISMGEMNAQIQLFIQNGKFENPVAESLRKKAAAQWAKQSVAVDRAISTLD